MKLMIATAATEIIRLSIHREHLLYDEARYDSVASSSNVTVLLSTDNNRRRGALQPSQADVLRLAMITLHLFVASSRAAGRAI
jgi:hypothetical protein